MERTVAFLEPRKTVGTAKLNSLYREKIDGVIKDPFAKIIVSSKFSFVIKYLEERKFQKCILYHIGDTVSRPIKIAGFKTKGGFTSNVELEEALRQDSTEIIED